MTATMDRTVLAEDDVPVAEDGPAFVADPLVLTNTETGDGRLIESLTWRDLPLPLRWVPQDNGGHDGAILVGRIDTITQDGDRITAYGVLDTSAAAQEVARLIDGRFLRGVSVDLDQLDVDMGGEDDDLMVVRSGRIAAATLVDIPAFEDAQVALVENTPAAAAAMIDAQLGVKVTPPARRPVRDVVQADMFAGISLVASARPAGPPARYFADPHLDRRHGFHVGVPDADGWVPVYGHVYGWGECHLGSPPGRCVTVPRGSTTRGLFAGVDGRGVLADDGTLIPTGPIALAADHADLSGLSWLGAKDHYAHTALAVADVTCGEDDYGIWVAGVLRPGISDEHVHALRASAPSGDWRAVNGQLELVAILAVNMPGFPALAASLDGGQVVALVASGGPTEAAAGCGCGGGGSEQAVSDALAALAPVVAVARRTLAAELEASLLGD